MAIKALNKKITGQTASGAFGPVPSGKSWVIKMIVVEVTTAGAAAKIELDIDGVKVAEDGSFGATLRTIAHLIGGTGFFSASALIPDIAFATDGQAVNVVRAAGGGATWSAHMTYLERDIP